MLSTSSSSAAAAAAAVEEVWCLCLHGCRQTAEIFSHQLSALETILASHISLDPPPVGHQNHHHKTGRGQKAHHAPHDRRVVIRLDYLEAPHAMPKLFEEDAAVPKSWCQPSSSSGVASSTPGKPREPKRRADQDEGELEVSWDYREGDRLLDAKLQERRYAFLLGFSQGGLMIARCVARHGGRIPTGALHNASSSASLSYVHGLIFIASPDITQAYHKPPSSSSSSSSSAPQTDRRRRSSLLLASAEESVIEQYVLSHTGTSSPQGGALSTFLPSEVPSLHIMGERDEVVPLKESDRFRLCCGPAATVLVHRHAHSVPHGKEAIRFIRDFFVTALKNTMPPSGAASATGSSAVTTTTTALPKNGPAESPHEKQYDENLCAPSLARTQRSPEEMAALKEARDNELEMIAAMYGEETVERKEESTTAIAAIVRLPLLGEEVWDHTEFDPVVLRWLGQLRLELHLPVDYPEEPPCRMRVHVVVAASGAPLNSRSEGTTTTTGAHSHPNPSSSSSSLPLNQGTVRVPHSVRFSRWAGELERQLAAYQQEEVGTGTEMIMPLLLHATAEASERLEALGEWLSAAKDGKEVEAAQKDREREEAAAAEAVAAAKKECIEEESLEDHVRQARAVAADDEAVRLLLSSSSSTPGGARKATTTRSALHAHILEEEIMATTVSHQTMAGGGGGGRGSWKLQIGLIGKPSAGKSTFFNAITDPESEAEAAKVAAFPFTTIEPNTGTGYAPICCPCSARPSRDDDDDDDDVKSVRNADYHSHHHDDHHHHYQSPAAAAAAAGPDGELISLVGASVGGTCTARYGHVRALGSPRYRRHPITVKDVAGLVKGAYQGRGKGNQFLNDLCEADVLVHVVDGAGATEADGTACAEGQGSVLEDISWVRAEVHFWIYDNLVAKWQSIQRQPQRLRTMFSGYRSGPAFVDHVLSKLGVNTNVNTSAMGGGGGGQGGRGLGPSNAEPIVVSPPPKDDGKEVWLEDAVRRWGWAEIHLLVAMYIRLRFPIVVALNKADLPSAAEIQHKLRRAYPNEILVPMSARIECDLLQLRKKKWIQYVSGEPGFTSLVNAPITTTTTTTTTTGGVSAGPNQSSPIAGVKPKHANPTPKATDMDTGMPKPKPTEVQLARVQAFFDAQHQRQQADESEMGEATMHASLAPPSSPLAPPLRRSTGVQDVLAVALGSCAMTVAFPVADFLPFFSLPPPSEGEGRQDAEWSIADAVCFRCGTPAEVVFGSLERMGAVEGKLVRFEVVQVRDLQRYHHQHQQQRSAAAAGGSGAMVNANQNVLSSVISSHTLVLRKTDPVPPGPVLVRVLTNKRQERKK